MTFLRDALVLVSWLILGYYLLINGLYLLVHSAALFELRADVRKATLSQVYRPFSSPFLPGVAVIVPAYNEEAVIVENVQSLLNLNYPDKEIVVVNDGSTDETLARLTEAFNLEATDAPVPYDVPSAEIRTVYQARDSTNLVVVDKENGGKADALNAGIWLTDQTLFCAVDADSIIDRDGLLQVVRPFLEHPEETVATGGTVRVSNGCSVEAGGVESVSLPDDTLAELQVMEYLRAFYSGRLGLDRFDSLLLISGAFGMFRTEVIRDIGGYDSRSITEDFELTVRLHRYLKEEERQYRIEFVPEPVVWTQVPTSRTTFSRQRRRWYRGLLDTMVRHRGMIGRRRYGWAGVFGFPSFLFGEVLGPLVEGMGYLIVPIAFLLGAVSPWFVLMYFVLAIGIGTILSWFGVMSEVWSFRRYDRPREVVRLLGNGVLENFGFRQWKTFIAWRGLIEFLRGDKSWGKMTRSKFERD